MMEPRAPSLLKGRGGKPRGGDAGEGAGFVDSGRVAADADRADELAARVADQHAARRKREPAAGGDGDAGEEGRIGGGAGRAVARVGAHAARTHRLGAGDVEAE